MDDAERAGGGARDQGAEVLCICPVCRTGQLVRAPQDKRTFACSSCGSTVEENIFGLTFKQVETKSEVRKGQFEGKTFTRPDLLAMTEKLSKSCWRKRKRSSSRKTLSDCLTESRDER